MNFKNSSSVSRLWLGWSVGLPGAGGAGGQKGNLTEVTGRPYNRLSSNKISKLKLTRVTGLGREEERGLNYVDEVAGAGGG